MGWGCCDFSTEEQEQIRQQHRDMERARREQAKAERKRWEMQTLQLEKALVPVVMEKRALLASDAIHVATTCQGKLPVACPTAQERAALKRALWKPKRHERE